MPTKKTQKKPTKTTKTVAKQEPFQPLRVTFGVAALAVVTLVVFALLLVDQILY